VSKLFFPDYKKGKFGENKTLPQVKKKSKQNKTFTAEALSSRYARPEGRRRRRRREHGVGRKRLHAMSRTTLLAADGRRRRWGVDHDRVDRFKRHLKVLSSVKSTVVAI
jgi:hypothetical protein